MRNVAFLKLVSRCMEDNCAGFEVEFRFDEVSNDIFCNIDVEY